MKDLNQLVNEAIAEQSQVNPEFRRLMTSVMPRSPKYRFFSNEKKDRYFWTTEKINHKGKPRYVAGIYRFYKIKKQLKLIRSVGFAKRFKAKEWARTARSKNI